MKLTADDCTDPDLTKVAATEQFTNCQGVLVRGTMVVAEESEPVPTPTVTVTPAPTPECTGNGQVGCATTATYKSADLTNLNADNIKSGVEIAGVGGNLSFSEPHSSCTDNAQTGCITTATYKSADLTNVVASNIRSGVNAAGVTGSLTVTGESHIDCSSNAEVGCVTTASYKAADFSNLTAANIKANVAIAGVTGEYPSASYPINGASGTADLNSETFNAKIKSGVAFEYFDSAGTRHTGTGDSNIQASNILSTASIFGTQGTVTVTSPNAWDIRENVVVNGTTGLARMTCRDDTSDASITCNTASWATHAAVDSHTVYTDRLTGLEWLLAASSPITATSLVSVCADLAAQEPGWRIPSKAEIKNALLHKMTTITPMGNYWASSGNLRAWSATYSGSYRTTVNTGSTDASVLATDTTTIGFCVK